MTTEIKSSPIIFDWHFSKKRDEESLEEEVWQKFVQNIKVAPSLQRRQNPSDTRTYEEKDKEHMELAKRNRSRNRR